MKQDLEGRVVKHIKLLLFLIGLLDKVCYLPPKDKKGLEPQVHLLWRGKKKKESLRVGKKYLLMESFEGWSLNCYTHKDMLA